MNQNPQFVIYLKLGESNMKCKYCGGNVGYTHISDLMYCKHCGKYTYLKDLKTGGI